MTRRQPVLRPVQTDPCADLVRRVEEFVELIEERRQAGWRNTPRPDLQRLAAAAMGCGPCPLSTHVHAFRAVVERERATGRNAVPQKALERLVEAALTAKETTP